MNYAISRTVDAEKLYLQRIEANEKYSKSATATTMGDRHNYSEYNTVWGREKKAFERLTATNYIKTLLEEFRWDRIPFFFQVEPVPEASGIEGVKICAGCNRFHACGLEHPKDSCSRYLQTNTTEVGLNDAH